MPNDTTIPAASADTTRPGAPHITHLISDCDGVLIESEAAALEALLTALCPRYGTRDLLRPLIQPRLGQRLEPLMLDLFLELELPVPDAAELAQLRSFVEGECDRHLELVHGVAQALAAIVLPMAVASNSNSARVKAALSLTGLEPQFGGRIFTPDLVGVEKPHPGLYLAAAAAFGVAPAQCVVIEDSVTGVTAGAAAGMHVLGFVGGGHVAPDQAGKLLKAGARTTFDAMEQLPALVKALSAVV